jgi:hypothetical protein
MSAEGRRGIGAIDGYHKAISPFEGAFTQLSSVSKLTTAAATSW